MPTRFNRNDVLWDEVQCDTSHRAGFHRAEPLATSSAALGAYKIQQLSEARTGSFVVQGFADNPAPDHDDLLHALPEILKNR